jgi:tellurite resistance protein TehA-like permease
MTRERIDALEADKQRLQAEVERLRSEIDRLLALVHRWGPENAALRERLDHAKSNLSFTATLIAISGLLLGIAQYSGRADYVAWIGAGLWLAAIVCMIWQRIRLWRTTPVERVERPKDDRP